MKTTMMKCISLLAALNLSFAFKMPSIITTNAISSTVIHHLQCIRIHRHPLRRFAEDEYSAKTGIAERTVVTSGTKRRGILFDDFNQIIEAINIYKRIYGDTRIVDRFEVPAEKPWPPSLHGLRLGKRLKRIITSREFESQYPDKAAALRRAGFEPDPSSFSDEWSVLVEALSMYKEVHGDLRINARYVVPSEAPWPKRAQGMNLGVRVAAIRSTGRFVKDSPDRKLQLEELGFEWAVRKSRIVPEEEDEDFAMIVAALQIYKREVNEEFVITNSYKVPHEEPWPQHLHGMKLGMIVKRIRQKNRYIEDREDRRQALLEIGFDFNDVTSRESLADSRFQVIFKALLKYKELHGTPNVPPAYVVPSEEPWPEDTWGIKLGARSTAIRTQGTFVSNSPERRQLLNAIGFNWDMRQRIRKDGDEDEQQQQQQQQQDAAAADAFEEREPRRLEFQSSLDQSIRDAKSRAAGFDTGEDAFTRAARAAAAAGLVDMPDGVESSMAKAVGSLKNQDLPDTILQELLVRGPFTSYPWFFGDTYREIASEARRDYLRYRDYHPDPAVRQFGHFEGWMQISELNEVMNRRISKEAKGQMMKLGYRMMDFHEFYWEDVLDALTIYKAAYGDADVPVSFVIDEEILEQNLGFPDLYRGMRLGSYVKGLRIGDYDGLEDSTRRKQLGSLGFNWGDLKYHLRFRFLPLFYGLRVYAHLYQIPMPPTSFVVPEEEQWPVWMYNMPLGEWAAAARIQQKLLREHYSDRVDLLDTLEFDWFIPPGPSMPSRYYRAVK